MEITNGNRGDAYRSAATGFGILAAEALLFLWAPALMRFLLVPIADRLGKRHARWFAIPAILGILGTGIFVWLQVTL